MLRARATGRLTEAAYRVLDLIVSSGSVFSEAFLVLGRVRPQGERAVNGWILLHCASLYLG